MAVSAAVNAVAVVVLVVITWKYAKATENLLNRVDKQLESAREQSELFVLTAEILARSGLVAAGAGDNSMTVLKLLAKEMTAAREKKKAGVVP